MRDTSIAGLEPRAYDILLEEFSLSHPTRIVDVGANPLSPPPYAELLARGACHVYGFEPQPAALEELQSTASAFETYFPHAVGRGGYAQLNICADSGLTSLYEPDTAAIRFLGRSKRNIRVVERVRLKTVTLDEIDEIEGFELLKIDIQGGEVDVFRGARRKLCRSLAVIPEVRFFPLYRGEPMLGGVDEELRLQGFVLHKFLFTKQKVIPSSQIGRLRRSVHRNQLIDGDAVYIRNLGAPESFGSEELMHLAILAAAVFESHDLVLYLLDELVRRKEVPEDLPAAYVDRLPPELRRD
ncbi:methyltransferase, FkbM family [Meinhardsimonia xiamenensis]|jgi:FkbM family methyltransferase|uniref:Methyltransferase, FkbM family n=1 Tax=Meinhardsimonia xiamenensis TaxID=990712 RepID=A0A1G9BKZ0_9RHOB|nr:FkbM family methyltransferase [Meinhardsimonia xiamenensis]PRX34939.1 FkbM family methyltransferase [Meinhardsimonia xiamenensis]SDK40136.1 methyltransferase, FkbM family [Meinhardsimonia xiamenensis]